MVVGRGPGEMGRQYDIVELQERVVGGRGFLVEHIEPGAENLALAQHFRERRLVDDGAAARIHQDSGRLHEGQLARADHVARGIVQRDIQRDEVAGPQQFLEQPELDADRVLFVLGQATDIEVDDLHAEGAREPGDLLADRAEADNAERLVIEFVHGRRRAIPAPASAAHARVLPDHTARDREHEHDCVLGDRDRISAAVVADGHAGRARGFDIDRVVTGAQELHELEFAGAEMK